MVRKGPNYFRTFQPPEKGCYVFNWSEFEHWLIILGDVLIRVISVSSPSKRPDGQEVNDSSSKSFSRPKRVPIWVTHLVVHVSFIDLLSNLN